MPKITALLALLSLALASAGADAQTRSASVLITQTIKTLTGTVDATLVTPDFGVKFLCLQNIGTGLVSLGFGAAVSAGAGWALNAAAGAGQAGGSICWDANAMPRGAIHGISAAGSSVAVLVGN